MEKIPQFIKKMVHKGETIVSCLQSDKLYIVVTRSFPEDFVGKFYMYDAELNMDHLTQIPPMVAQGLLSGEGWETLYSKDTGWEEFK